MTYDVTDLAYEDVEAALFLILVDTLGYGVREADAGTRLVLAAHRGWTRVSQ